MYTIISLLCSFYNIKLSIEMVLNIEFHIFMRDKEVKTKICNCLIAFQYFFLVFHGLMKLYDEIRTVITLLL